jgi:hypothetical protein
MERAGGGVPDRLERFHGGWKHRPTSHRHGRRVSAIYARTAGVDGRNTPRSRARSPGHDGEDTVPVTVKAL